VARLAGKEVALATEDDSRKSKTLPSIFCIQASNGVKINGIAGPREEWQYPENHPSRPAVGKLKKR
jgi:hypothetical protein